MKKTVIKQCIICEHDFQTRDDRRRTCGGQCAMTHNENTHADYQKKHPEVFRANLKKWRKKNPEKCRAIAARHYAKHRERIRAQQDQYYEEHRDEILARRRERRKDK